MTAAAAIWYAGRDEGGRIGSGPPGDGGQDPMNRPLPNDPAVRPGAHAMTGTPWRREYGRARLGEADVEADPIRQFQIWFAEALAAEIPDANAMTLATATPDGGRRPASCC
jgi:hypothetical protein